MGATPHRWARAASERRRSGLSPAVALFLKFQGIDYDADAAAGARLDAYIRWVQQVVTTHEGFLMGVNIGDKGSYVQCAFGATAGHEDDALRAGLAALELQAIPAELDYVHSVRIGLTQGIFRTGAYGSVRRRTYGVFADEVNQAARLMQHARPGETLASERLHWIAPPPCVPTPLRPKAWCISSAAAIAGCCARR